MVTPFWPRFVTPKNGVPVVASPDLRQQFLLEQVRASACLWSRFEADKAADLTR